MAKLKKRKILKKRAKEVTPTPEVAEKKSRVKVGSVTEANLEIFGVTFPLEVFVQYGPRGEKKEKYPAVMNAPDFFVFNGSEFTSATLAAKALTKTPVNGWTFWKFNDAQGNTHAINALRTGEVVARKRKAAGEVKESPFEQSGITVPLPDEDLPTRNTRYTAAMYFVNPAKFKRYGHVVVYLYNKGTLAYLIFNKKGKVIGNEKLGSDYVSWKACQDDIADHAKENKLQQAKLEAE